MTATSDFGLRSLLSAQLNAQETREPHPTKAGTQSLQRVPPTVKKWGLGLVHFNSHGTR